MLARISTTARSPLCRDDVDFWYLQCEILHFRWRSKRNLAEPDSDAGGSFFRL